MLLDFSRACDDFVKNIIIAFNNRDNIHFLKTARKNKSRKNWNRSKISQLFVADYSWSASACGAFGYEGGFAKSSTPRETQVIGMGFASDGVLTLFRCNIEIEWK